MSLPPVIEVHPHKHGPGSEGSTANKPKPPSVLDKTRAGEARNYRDILIPDLLRDYEYGDTAKNMIRASRLINSRLIPPPRPRPAGVYPVTFRLTIRRGDILTIARMVMNGDFGSKPRFDIAIVNEADGTAKGGSFLNGGVGAEEDLCMRTTLYENLLRRHYPLKEHELLFSPHVLAIERDAPKREDGTYTVFPIDIISCAPVKRTASAAQNSPDEFAQDEEKKLFKDKLKSIIKVAASNNITTLIIGAFGCGSKYHNPPEAIAKLMHEVFLNEDPNEDYKPHDWAQVGLEQIMIVIEDSNVEISGPIWDTFVRTFSINGSSSDGMIEITKHIRWPDLQILPHQVVNPTNSSFGLSPTPTHGSVGHVNSDGVSLSGGNNSNRQSSSGHSSGIEMTSSQASRIQAFRSQAQAALSPNSQTSDGQTSSGQASSSQPQSSQASNGQASNSQASSGQKSSAASQTQAIDLTHTSNSSSNTGSVIVINSDSSSPPDDNNNNNPSNGQSPSIAPQRQIEPVQLQRIAQQALDLLDQMSPQ